MRQKYGSRRSRRSNSGFPNVTSLKRMAKRFKSAATTKIQERTGLQPGPASNLASQMASALLTGNVNVSSTEASAALAPSMKYYNDEFYILFLIIRFIFKINSLIS